MLHTEDSKQDFENKAASGKALNTISTSSSKNELGREMRHPDLVIQNEDSKIVMEAKKQGSASKDGKVIELGPLESIFPCSASRILDFLTAFKAYDYSISDIAKYSGVSFKTALNEIKNSKKKKLL